MILPYGQSSMQASRGNSMPPNNALERSRGHRGRAVLAMDDVLAGAGWPPCQAAQLGR
jgi:hypothetical protein